MKTAITRTDLNGKYINDDAEGVSYRIVGVGPTNVSAIANWRQVDEYFRWSSKGRTFPGFVQRFFLIEEVLQLELANKVSTSPIYHEEILAFPVERGNMLLTPRRKRGVNTVVPNRSRHLTKEGESQMAKTACFDAEGVLINIYESGKEAKAANKGTDVQFVTAKNFPEGGIGEYQTAADLFPAPEPVVKEDSGEKRTRTVIKREGAYTVVKADGARFPEGDQRDALHSALIGNTTVEAYLEAAPAEAVFTSSRGAEQKVSAAGYMAYGFKRGWIAQSATEE